MSPNPPAPSRGARPLIPYVVLAGSLAVTVVVATYMFVGARAKGRAQFDNLTERNQEALRRRLDTYVALLRGAAGLFAAHENRITRAQFAAYIDRLDIHERYPEIQGIGVSGMSVGDDLAGLVATMRKAGVDNVEIRPAGPRQQYHAVVYLEPQTPRNRGVIGYDMFTDPTRRAAMELARDTGNAVTSAKVTLHASAGDDGQVGFLVFVPIYVSNVTPAAVDDRRKAIGGYIFSPFRVEELMTGIFGKEPFPSGVSFAVYDGPVKPETLLYESAPASERNVAGARFAKTVQFAIPGGEWTIRYANAPDFDAASSGGVAAIIVAGVAVSILLFALTAAEASARRRAEHAAHETRLAKEAAELALDVAERASASKDEFLATVSHELRTPLTPALLAISSLEREPGLPPQVCEDVRTVREHIETEARLISDLFDMTRIVRGGLRLDTHDVDLHSLLRGVVARRRETAGATVLRAELSATRHVLRGDAARLRQVFENLIDNAQKFTPAGGTITVRTSDARATATTRTTTTTPSASRWPTRASASTAPCCPRSSARSSKARSGPSGSTPGWAWGWRSRSG